MTEHYTACFTGHRPQNLECKFDPTHPLVAKIKDALKIKIIKHINDNNITDFITGMALGVDTWAAEIVLKLKEKYPIHLIAAIPYLAQPDRWHVADINKYTYILDRCDEVNICQKEYTKSALMKRNQWMVDNSGIVIAVYDTNLKGGTYQTINYALKKGKVVDLIDLTKFDIKDDE